MSIPYTSTVAAPNPFMALAQQETSGFGGGMMESDFMVLLLAQLRNQNPLEPMQDKDMMAQFTQVNSLRELQQINQTLLALSGNNQLSDASGLLGKVVQYMSYDGSLQAGTVTGVSLDQGQVVLWLGEKQVLLSEVRSVFDGGPEIG